MKLLLKMLLFLVIGQMASAQIKKQSCNCPTGQDLAHQGAPEKIFYFKNGQQIGLCGDIEPGNKDTIYSEVILYHCGAEGFFRGWNGTQTCKITQDNDTVVVEKLVKLPVGKNMEVVSTSFRIEKFYYSGSKFITLSVYRTDLPKYTPAQIKNVLDQYTSLTRGDYDKALLVYRQLFWSYVSGSSEADEYLEKFEQQFGPFTERFDEFDEIRGLYWFWNLNHLN